MPQVVVKKRKVKKAREGLERSRRIAKQVLSQLSYTPKVTAQRSFYSIYAANSSLVSAFSVQSV